MGWTLETLYRILHFPVRKFAGRTGAVFVHGVVAGDDQASLDEFFVSPISQKDSAFDRWLGHTRQIRHRTIEGRTVGRHGTRTGLQDDRMRGHVHSQLPFWAADGDSLLPPLRQSHDLGAKEPRQYRGQTQTIGFLVGVHGAQPRLRQRATTPMDARRHRHDH